MARNAAPLPTVSELSSCPLPNNCRPRTLTFSCSHIQNGFIQVSARYQSFILHNSMEYLGGEHFVGFGQKLLVAVNSIRNLIRRGFKDISHGHACQFNHMLRSTVRSIRDTFIIVGGPFHLLMLSV